MSNHNYSQYSNKKNRSAKQASPAIVERTSIAPVAKPVNVPVESPAEVKMVVETVDTMPLSKTVEGVVVNCAKLNVRAEPSIDAEVVCVLNGMSEIEIDVSKSNKDWFSVCTATGIEGYCMSKFVDARL